MVNPDKYTASQVNTGFGDGEAEATASQVSTGERSICARRGHKFQLIPPANAAGAWFFCTRCLKREYRSLSAGE